MNQSRRTRLERLEDTLDPEEARREVILHIEYDAYQDEPPLLGERYVLALPRKRRARKPGIGPPPTSAPGCDQLRKGVRDAVA